MTDKSNVKELAEKFATAKLLVEMLGQANQPWDVNERIKQDARYELAKAAHVAAELDYREAIKGLSAAELSELAA